MTARNWEKTRQEMRIKARGSEAVSPDGFTIKRVGAKQQGSKRLAEYLATKPKPLPDPVDAMARPLTPKEKWLRDVLDVDGD